MSTAKKQVNLMSYLLAARVADILTFHGRLATNFQHAAGHTQQPGDSPSFNSSYGLPESQLPAKNATASASMFHNVYGR